LWPLSSYLAGLIESDGSIVVPGKDIKSYKPFFEITFHLEDLRLAEILQSTIGGIIQIRGKKPLQINY
jgi:LAGLIDADG endonuclease